VTHPCPRCKKTTSGPRNNHCERCASLNRIEKLAAFYVNAFEQEWVKELFQGFIAYRKQQESLEATQRNMPHHVDFFSQIDTYFADLNEINTVSLTRALGSYQLSRYRLASDYLSRQLARPLEGQERIDCAEEERIFRQIRSCEAPHHYEVLSEYHDSLKGRDLKPLTRRLYIKAARNLLESTKHVTRITHKRLGKHLLKHPGHRASLSAFVRYLNTYHGRDLYIHTTSNRTKPNTSALASELKVLVQAATDATSHSARSAYVAKALALSFGLYLGDILKLKPEQVRATHDGIAICIRNSWYEVREPLQSLTRQVVANKAEHSDYVFSGKAHQYSMSPSTVWYYAAKLNADSKTALEI
jgi:hypothetical protein